MQSKPAARKISDGSAGDSGGEDIIRVLLVEDNPGDARLTEEAIRDAGDDHFKVEVVNRLGDALDRLGGGAVDVVLLDLSLPDSRGLDTFERVRESAPDAAVIVLSGLDDEELATTTVQHGGEDYLVKGEFEGRLLGRTIRYAHERKRLRNHLRQLADDLAESNRELKATQLQLIQAEKMESLGRLAAGVAHEVKNPLARILLGVEYLSGGVAADDENLPIVIEEIKTSAERATQIIRGMVDFSSAGRLDRNLVDAGALIREALIMVKHEVTRSGAVIVSDIDRDLPKILGDRGKLEQVLVNLLINALHSLRGSNGKTISIRAFADTVSEVPRNQGLRTGLHLRDGDEVVKIQISDEGLGIPPEVLGNIFDPFFTTKAAGEGTGLGLTVVRKIIDLHHGMIHIDNKQRGGVRVTLTLKAQSGPSEML